MPEIATVVLNGDLSPKWGNLVAPGRGVTLTRCTGSPADVLAHCRRLTSCVLVVDGGFVHEVDPEEFCDVVNFGLSIQVLVELEQSHLLEAEELIRIGCAGYVSKDASRTEACSALRALLAGELWASRVVISSVLRNILRAHTHQLTVREGEILGLVSEGLKNSEIAERLFISPQTVRWHLRSLYRKLGTHDRSLAVVRAPLSDSKTRSNPKPGSVSRPVLPRAMSAGYEDCL